VKQLKYPFNSVLAVEKNHGKENTKERERERSDVTGQLRPVGCCQVAVQAKYAPESVAKLMSKGGMRLTNQFFPFTFQKLSINLINFFSLYNNSQITSLWNFIAALYIFLATNILHNVFHPFSSSL